MQATSHWGWITFLYMFSGKEGTDIVSQLQLCLDCVYVTTTQGTPGSSLRRRRLHFRRSSDVGVKC